MLLSTDVWVGALIRRAQLGGAFATVARKGDARAGAQAGIDAGDALATALGANDVSHARFHAYERGVEQRYRWFRRFAIGFYDPAFRDIFFVSDVPLGIREAVLSVMAGNWRPSLATRLRLMAFFAVIAVHRRFPIAPRVPDLAAGTAPSPTAS